MDESEKNTSSLSLTKLSCRVFAADCCSPSLYNIEAKIVVAAQKKNLKRVDVIGTYRSWLLLNSLPGAENSTRYPIIWTNCRKYEVKMITIFFLQMTSPSLMDLRIRLKPSTKKHIEMNMIMISLASKDTVDNQTALFFV